MKFPIIEYNQNNYHFISTVLPFDLINSSSETLVYGKKLRWISKRTRWFTF